MGGKTPLASCCQDLNEQHFDARRAHLAHTTTSTMPPITMQPRKSAAPCQPSKKMKMLLAAPALLAGGQAVATAPVRVAPGATGHEARTLDLSRARSLFSLSRSLARSPPPPVLPRSALRRQPRSRPARGAAGARGRIYRTNFGNGNGQLFCYR